MDCPSTCFPEDARTPPWNNTTVLRGSPGAEVAELRKRSGKDLVLLAGAEIARVVMAADVIDAYCVFIYPLVLGSGYVELSTPQMGRCRGWKVERSSAEKFVINDGCRPEPIQLLAARRKAGRSRAYEDAGNSEMRRGT
jgi:RibD C-terminal domain